MSRCELTEGCIFFNDKMVSMPSMAELYKQRYCRDGLAACARYQVFERLGRPAVPADLYPNDLERAASIISAS